jgi:hypothetical protein
MADRWEPPLILELTAPVYARGGAFAAGERYLRLSFRIERSLLDAREAEIAEWLGDAHRCGLLDETRYFTTLVRMLHAGGRGLLRDCDPLRYRELTGAPPLSDDQRRAHEEYTEIYDRLAAAGTAGSSAQTVAEAVTLLRECLSDAPPDDAGARELAERMRRAPWLAVDSAAPPD